MYSLLVATTEWYTTRSALFCPRPAGDTSAEEGCKKTAEPSVRVLNDVGPWSDERRATLRQKPAQSARRMGSVHEDDREDEEHEMIG